MKLKYIVLSSALLFAAQSKSSAASTHVYGVYWGTFDPPTLAHQAIINQAFSVGIEHLFVVVNNHGHKPYCASISDRLAMLQLAVDPQLAVTYLVQDATCAWGMQELKNSFGGYPETAWYLFSGQENLAYWDLKNSDPHDKIVIIERQGSTTVISDAVLSLKLAIPVSSTAVRIAIKQKDSSWRALVPPSVVAYIEEHALYH